MWGSLVTGWILLSFLLTQHEKNTVNDMRSADHCLLGNRCVILFLSTVQASFIAGVRDHSGSGYYAGYLSEQGHILQAQDTMQGILQRGGHILQAQDTTQGIFQSRDTFCRLRILRRVSFRAEAHSAGSGNLGFFWSRGTFCKKKKKCGSLGLQS